MFRLVLESDIMQRFANFFEFNIVFADLQIRLIELILNLVQIQRKTFTSTKTANTKIPS